MNRPPLTRSEIIPLENVEKIDLLQKEIELKNKEIIKKNKAINKKDKEMKRLLDSNSWKITKPLRKFKSILKK